MPLRIRPQSAITSLSLTPLIDVVFLLLIFFLVATRFAEEEHELDLELPSATEARPLVARPREIFVNIDQQGRFYMDGEFLASDGLEQRLSLAALHNPAGQTVIIRADGKCKFSDVAAATDACHRAGIHDIRLHSQKK